MASDSSSIHSVYFPDNEWTLGQASEWLMQHDLYPIKDPRKYGHYFRFRIRDPKLFRSYMTKVVMHGNKRIYLVIGFY